MLKLPSLTELFFGKGVDPATYRGENKTPAYLTGKGKKLNKSKENGMTAKKPEVKWTSKKGIGIEDVEDPAVPAKKMKKKPIKEVKKAPKNTKTKAK